VSATEYLSAFERRRWRRSTRTGRVAAGLLSGGPVFVVGEVRFIRPLERGLKGRAGDYWHG
jgi:hypothetical protein